jgi:hypothetical protein
MLSVLSKKLDLKGFGKDWKSGGELPTNENNVILQFELGVLGSKLLGMVYEPSFFFGGYIFTGATSNWKMKHLDICMHFHSRFRIRNFLKYVCDIYSWCILCLSNANNVFFYVAMSAVERLVSFLEKLCLLGLRLSLIFTGATSSGKMKHHDICMHSHTRFRIRKLPKHVCDIYS